MPKLSRRHLLITLLPVVLALLFPRWTLHTYRSEGAQIAGPAGNHYIFSPPTADFSLQYSSPEDDLGSPDYRSYEISVAETVLQVLAAFLLGALVAFSVYPIKTTYRAEPPGTP